MRAFHVTPKENIPSILKSGLVPKIGERSAQYTCEGKPIESAPRVYLFPTREDCDTALSQWLGDEFEDIEDNGLVIIEVELKGLQLESDVSFEVATTHKIKPSRIISIYDEAWLDVSHHYIESSDMAVDMM